MNARHTCRRPPPWHRRLPPLKASGARWRRRSCRRNNTAAARQNLLLPRPLPLACPASCLREQEVPAWSGWGVQVALGEQVGRGGEGQVRLLPRCTAPRHGWRLRKYRFNANHTTWDGPDFQTRGRLQLALLAKWCPRDRPGRGPGLAEGALGRLRWLAGWLAELWGPGGGHSSGVAMERPRPGAQRGGGVHWGRSEGGSQRGKAKGQPEVQPEGQPEGQPASQPASQPATCRC